MNVTRKIVSTHLFTLSDQLMSRKANKDSSVIINGFWRSGTTFLMQSLGQLLNRRTFYEPLHEGYPNSKILSPGSPFFNNKGISQICPYWKDCSTKALKEFSDDLLIGQSSSEWVRRHRTLSNNFNAEAVIKFVRGNLLIPYFANEQIKNLFLIRHPAAVISSMTRKHSNASQLLRMLGSRDYIENVILSQPNLREFLEKNGWDINRFPNEPIYNIMYLYCIMHEIPMTELADTDAKPHVILFEKMTIEPKEVFQGMTKYLKLPELEDDLLSKVVKQPSGTTKAERVNIDKVKRLFSWQEDVNKEDIAKCYEVPEKLGMSHILSVIEKIDKLRSDYE